MSPTNPKATRSRPQEAIFHLPLICGLDPKRALPFLSVHARIVAAERNSPVSLAQADLRGPIAILVGRESTGLPEEIARYASQFLCIPIRKEVDSVNAATAASIFLYMRQPARRGFQRIDSSGYRVIDPLKGRFSITDFRFAATQRKLISTAITAYNQLNRCIN